MELRPPDHSVLTYEPYDMAEQGTVDQSPDDLGTDSDSKRIRSLTGKGAELYETNRRKYIDKLRTSWDSVELHLKVPSDTIRNLSELHQAKAELEQNYKHYKKVAYEYSDFLSRTNTAETCKDLEVHDSISQARDLLVTNMLAHIACKIQLALETASHRSKTKSRSSRSSSVLDSNYALARVKAKAEAAKKKAEFATEEAVIKKKQAAIAEKQQLLAVQTARLQAELAADLECLQSHGKAAETAAEAEAMASIEGDKPSHISLPRENSSERTRRYVEQHSDLVGSLDFLEDTPWDKVQKLSDVKSQRKTTQPSQHTDRAGPSTSQGRAHTETKFSGGKVVVGKSTVQGLSSTLDPDAVSYKPLNSSPQTPYFPSANQTSYVGNNNALTHELTNFLLKKELLLTRLNNCNDQPESYNSWKSSFLSVVRELGVNSTEHVDLLIRWLGPQSVKSAISLKAANINNTDRALHLIWERLDERYGAAEMVEHALKVKLERFPKLTNKDNKLLYELADIVAEIESLKQNDTYSTLLAYFDSSSGVLPIVRKLTYSLQEKWTSRASDYKARYGVPFPPFSFFVSFIKEISRTRNDPSFAYEVRSDTGGKKTENWLKPNNTRVISAKKTDVVVKQKSDEETSKTCPLHKTKHSLNDCRGFRSKTIEERKEILKEHGLCFRCCSSKKHTAKVCTTPIMCSQCNSRQHPDALHVNRGSDKTAVSQSENGGETGSQVNSKCTRICGNQFTGKSCSKTILIDVHPKGFPQNCKRIYAILDEQSNVSLAKTEFFDMFEEKGQPMPYRLSSCNGMLQTAGRFARNYVITALDGSACVETSVIVECDQIPDERDEIPIPEITRNYPHLREIQDFIPQMDNDAKILLLIGRDVPDAHHVLTQITGPPNSPYAQQLPLGWVIIGETCLGKVHRPDFTVNKTYLLNSGQPSHFVPCDMDLTLKHYTCAGQDDLTSHVFVTTKDDNKKGTSVEDRNFLQIMDKQVFKETDGNWTAPLPFKTPRQRLPDNKPQAVKRARTLHHSLENNPTKKEHFFEFMGKILEAGHAESAPPLKPDEERWYLPLFGVYNPKKPDQIRGVFDSSARHEGVSLNDVLLTGPDLTNSLLGILLRFRREPVAVTADIERMFYCFYVREDHRNFLRFFWYKGNDFRNGLVEYRMKVHVFGNSPSPAVATYCLRKAAQEGNRDQDIIDFVTNDFYVDDALTSLPTHDEAVDVLKRTQCALSTGGKVRLHKIVSYSQQVMDAFPATDHAKDLKDLDLGTDTIPLQRSLGLAWDAKTDTITFQISAEQKPFTRLFVLSTISSLFDPLGFVAPIVIRGKMPLRELMSETRDWDEPMPPQREEQWEEWKVSLQSAQQLSIPRPYAKSAVSNTDIQIFSDASEKAIAAVAYMRTSDKPGSQNTSFLLGKAKLAPLHGHTIPRLELCATVLAVEIGETISEHMNIDPGSIQYYTDSKVVLGYLHNETRRFQVYVSNRVERVRRSSSPAQWGYVATGNNPADSATRDLPCTNITQSRWLQGPSQVLTQAPDNYPLVQPDEDQDIRQVKATKTHLSTTSLDTSRFQRFSSWKKLVRALARLKHIAGTFRKGNTCKGWHACPEARNVGLLSDTEKLIFKLVQADIYSTEICCINEKKSIPGNSPISSLCPILDEDGLLRVGGRLNRSTLSSQGMNPVIIPGKHHIALLLIRHHHESTRHQGRHITEGAIRSAGLWVTGCKRLVSSLCHTCVKCRRLRACTSTQIMADLPPQRLSPAPPFTYVGVDTFGHWTIVTRKTRGGAASSKRWAVIFSCLVTRAVHIEVVEDMSASAFINSMRRFLAVRGRVKQFYSDRGTNFVGATKELAINTINVEDDQVQDFLNNTGVEWIFNPPHSSHMGGSWERMIRTTRNILNSMLTDVSAKNLTHDVLVTFLAEVSAIINARPLVPVSSDPESPFILSPNMLLTHKSDLPTEPPTDWNIRDMYSKQWKRVQLLAEIFWKRWRREYLHLLQVRNKWKAPTRNFVTGDVILLKDKDLHRNDWSTGVVTDTIPSSDGNVRKVVVRVSRDGKRFSYTRPVSELVLLLPNY